MARIYHLLTESEPFSEQNGGAISRWVANVTRHHQDVIVLAPSSDASWGFEPARVQNIPELIGHKNFIQNGGHLLPWTGRLMMLRRIIGPALDKLRAGDTVWVHGRPEFGAALEPMVHAAGARLFLHLHNSHLVQWSTRITRAVHADCYVFNSRFLRDEALAKFPLLGRTEVLPNGADPRLFYPAVTTTPAAKRRNVPQVLFAARLVPDKGLHVFIEAMARLAADGEAIQGVVVGGAAFGGSGTTPYIREMQAKAPANVRFEPYCAGPAFAELFRNSDIYCLPACWHDPFPMTVLEAMATGLPVVASESGGIPDQLAEGGGLLVPRNSPAKLAEALGRLAQNRGLREEIGTEALASFRRNFTWERVRVRYREILAAPSMPMALVSESAPIWSHQA